MNQLVSTEWLEKNLQKVKILDATWFLPNSNKDAYEEYKIIHIKNSIFFDLDKSSNQNSKLPHMLPSKLDWEQLLFMIILMFSDPAGSGILSYISAMIINLSLCSMVISKNG